MTKPIRLAMIKCDTHAYWYAPFMVRCDGMKLQENRNYVHCFLTNMYQPSKFIIPRVKGIKLAKVWDRDVKVAERFAEAFPDKPEVCSSLNQACKDVDAAFIACCSEDGWDHLALARPFIKRGIPTFVDKPFAVTMKDARAMVSLARKHKTPIMSGSLLSYSNEVEWLKKRVEQELGPPKLAVIKGCNGWRSETGLEGISHGVALALATFGYGVESVQCMGELPLEFLLLQYPDGRKAMVMNAACHTSGGFFYSRVWGQNSTPNTPVRNDVESDGIGDPQYIKAGSKVIKLFKKMIDTKKPPISYEHMLEWVEVIEKGRRSQEIGKAVKLSKLKR